MIAEFLLLSGLVGLLVGMDRFHLIPVADRGTHAAAVFGFILLGGYLAGRLARRFRAPQITGYLMAGILFGPYLFREFAPSLGVIPQDVLARLSIFNHLALGLIAFSAGGELKLAMLKERARSVAWVVAAQVVVTIAVVTPLVMIAGPRFRFLHDLSFGPLLGVGFLFGVVAVAKSPASTIALILEYRAEGPLTTTTLGVTILKDVVVIVLFSFGLIAAERLLGLGAELGPGRMALYLAWEVIGSIVFGVVLGFLVDLYIRRVKTGIPLVLLGIAYLAMVISQDLGLSGLLMCMVAGFVIENFTDRGDALIHALARYSLPVFIVFFAINGANLDWSLLSDMWPFVFLLLIARLAAVWLGTRAGSMIAGDSAAIRRNLWLGFITQAGVTLGLATLIEARIPGLGTKIKTIVIAMIAVNQIIGPLAFRFGLLRSGEAKSP